VKPIPDGHRTVAPYLAIKNAAGALEFYKKAFGAIEAYKLIIPDGRVGHAPGSIHLYVEDVDAFFKRALAAGARELKPIANQFYGDRSGQLEDPYGHLWWVATHKEDIVPEEMRKRVQALFARAT